MALVCDFHIVKIVHLLHTALKLILHNQNRTHGSSFLVNRALPTVLGIWSTHGSDKNQCNPNNKHTSYYEKLLLSKTVHTHHSYLWEWHVPNSSHEASIQHWKVGLQP